MPQPHWQKHRSFPSMLHHHIGSSGIPDRYPTFLINGIMAATKGILSPLPDNALNKIGCAGPLVVSRGTTKCVLQAFFYVSKQSEFATTTGEFACC